VIARLSLGLGVSIIQIKSLRYQIAVNDGRERREPSSGLTMTTGPIHDSDRIFLSLMASHHHQMLGMRRPCICRMALCAAIIQVLCQAVI
jgi:hypothetical protein